MDQTFVFGKKYAVIYTERNNSIWGVTHKFMSPILIPKPVQTIIAIDTERMEKGYVQFGFTNAKGFIYQWTDDNRDGSNIWSALERVPGSEDTMTSKGMLAT